MSMAEAQQLAAQTVMAVRAGHNLSDELSSIFAAHPQLSPQDKGALQDMAFGCQRFSGSLRFMLAEMLNKPIDNQQLESLLIVALYQLNHSRNAAHAVVNEAVSQVARIDQGQYRSFANAILRRFQREKDTLNSKCKTDEVAKYNMPEWLSGYLKDHYPKHWHNIITACTNHPPMTLRINCRHTTAEHYIEQLQAVGLDGKTLGAYTIKLNQPAPVSQLPGFEEGTVSVQDFGAQQAAYLLAPQNGERILDACAAPGGKTGHLLELADCNVTALDIDAQRLTRVQSNLDRLGFQATLVAAPAQDLGAWYDGQPYDAILADLPCTASGVIRRHPDIKWLRRPTDAAKTARQQEPLLNALWQTLKPGGRMLLATCSIFEEENQQQLHAFLNRHADARCRESHVLLPNDKQDGFFYALIEKQ